MEVEIVLRAPAAYTPSILPNLLVPGIVDALKRLPPRFYFYVANMMQQAGETEGTFLQIRSIGSLLLYPIPTFFTRCDREYKAEISDEMLEKYAQMGLKSVVNDMIAVKKYRLQSRGCPW